MRLEHPFPPFYRADSRVLVLGSFPSVRSREEGFFYGHPRNRFWRVLATIRGLPVPERLEDRKELLTVSRVALWDVISSCEIEGSADASIRDVAVNDLRPLLSGCPIEAVYANGAAAFKLYEKYIAPAAGRPAVMLPSTSPANAAWTLDKLIDAWRVILR